MATRKKYSPEYKLDAISLVTDQGYTRTAAAKSLGINAQMLGRWIKEQQEDSDKAFRNNGKLSPEQKEIKHLKEQVKRLEMEKEILKNVWSAPILQVINRLFGKESFASMYPACLG